VTPEDTSPAGLQAGKQSQRYTYSVSERLLRISDGSSANNGQGAEIARYAYDPFGRRIKKTVSQTPSGQGSTGTTLYFYADEGLIAEVDGSPTTNGGNITTTYGWMPNNTWGTAPQWKRDHAEQSGATDVQGSANTNGITHYVHVDHLGTSQRLTNAQGETTWRMVSEAFGKTFVDTALAPATTGSTTNNLRFPGQYEDQETATHYNYMRTYLPMVGRYGETDPIGLAAGVNTFVYVVNRPLNAFDPKGLLQWNVLPTQVSGGYVPGQSYEFAPGLVGRSDQPNAGGTVISSWTITPACEYDCQVNKWRLQEFNVNIAFTIFLLDQDRYKCPALRSYVINAEMEHLDDFNRWAKTDGYALASQLESSLRSRTYFDQGNCVTVSRRALMAAMRTSFEVAYDSSRSHYDGEGGKHKRNWGPSNPYPCK
jgi:RHS repeat-associated protein